MIRIFPEWELLSYFLKGFFLKYQRMDSFLSGFMIKDISQSIYHHTVSGMVNIISIIANPVYANYITLVLDSPCSEKGLPCRASSFGPVGHIE